LHATPGTQGCHRRALIRTRLSLHYEVLYPTALLVRAAILAVLIALHLSSRDPFFLVLVGIVGLGVVLTGFSYLSERRAA
jgi:hypothetical protein